MDDGNAILTGLRLTLAPSVKMYLLVADRAIAIAGVEEPIIRQTVLESTSMLMPGKPIALGSIDISGSTRHLEVEVTVSPAH